MGRNHQNDVWRVTLFGALAVQRGDVRITRFETRKVDGLLACLALRYPQSLAREVLGETLWPDEDWDAVRSRIRRTLSSLRRDLSANGHGIETVCGERDSVWLNPQAVSVDVDEFSRAIRQAKKAPASEGVPLLEGALLAYSGPLLPGWYDDWVVRERERLERDWADATLRLGQLLCDRGDAAGAIGPAQRLLEDDPLREDATLLLMRCYAATGRPAEALRQFKELERVLQEELGAAPSEDARSLFEDVRAGRLRPASPEITPIDMKPSEVPDPAAASRQTLKDPKSPGQEPDGGAVPLDSEFYIERPADRDFAAALARQDSIVLVKGAHHMGKTSLLARGIQMARQRGNRVVLTDLQMLTAEQLESADALLLTLAGMICDQLDLDVTAEEYWRPQFGWNVNFDRFVRRIVLGQVGEPLLWGLDEVDRLFGRPYTTEVFGLFRAWHNARSLNPDGPWGRLTIAIAYATEAHLFITNLNQSPFNVGTRLSLDDFTRKQVGELNERYGSPLPTDKEIDRLYSLLNGHPYLTRRALHSLTSQSAGIDWLEAEALREDGIFADALQRMLDPIRRDDELCEAVRNALQGRPCAPESFYRLRSAGVLSSESASPGLRCRLFGDFLRRRLS